MSIESVVFATVGGLAGVAVLYHIKRRNFVERRVVERRMVEDRRLMERGRRAQDVLGEDDGTRFVRRSGPDTRRRHFRRKEDRVAANEKKITP